MNGAPRCDNPKCGSWNTVLIDAPYGDRVGERVASGGVLSLPFALIGAALDKSLKFWECKDCGSRWRRSYV